MKKLVVDTNVLVSILVDPTEEMLNFTLNHEMHAPNLLKIELANVCRKYHTLQNVPLNVVMEYFTRGLGLVSKFYSNDKVLERAVLFSFELNHPIYDCIYLSLANKLKMPFVSSDKRLVTKATTLGIEGLIFEELFL